MEVSREERPVPATRLHEYDEPEAIKAARAAKYLRSLGYKVDPPLTAIASSGEKLRAA